MRALLNEYESSNTAGKEGIDMSGTSILVIVIVYLNCIFSHEII